MSGEQLWALPSDSRRVRTLLYISEGVIFGAGSLLTALRFAGAYLVDLRTGSFDPHITPFGVFTLLPWFLLALHLTVRWRGDSPSQDKSIERQDWSETRQWRWVVIIGLSASVLLVGVALANWSLWEIVFLRSFDLLLFGSALVGVLLYVYVLHKFGM